MITALGDKLSDFPILQDFITLFLGLVVEAFPFVVLGVLVSVAVGLFFKEEWLFKLLPKNRILSHVVLSLLGVFMPVCECGNVPVVRRFLLKGFSVSHAVTFLLAAPIINPITIFATSQAFSFDSSVVVIRVVAAFLIANLIGIIISFKKDQNEFLTEAFYEEVCHVHEHKHKQNKGKEALKIFEGEFIEIMKMLIIGALIAAASQTFIPRDVIVAIGSNPVFSIFAMLILAFVISICANVDAFFALTYANTFTLGSILTFLTFGPMIDIKMLTMLQSTFRANLLVIMIMLVSLSSILVGLMVNFFL